jgi:hypothetical protein
MLSGRNAHDSVEIGESLLALPQVQTRGIISGHFSLKVQSLSTIWLYSTLQIVRSRSGIVGQEVCAMRIVLCVIATVLAQLAIAWFVTKCFRARKKKRVGEAVSGYGDPPPQASGTGRAHPAIDTYAELAALLIALSPQAEETSLKEGGAPLDLPEPKMPGPWPGNRK